MSGIYIYIKKKIIVVLGLKSRVVTETEHEFLDLKHRDMTVLEYGR